MGGDEQEGVKKAPPIRLGEITAQALRDQGQRGYELDSELAGIKVLRRGDYLDCLPEPGGTSEPDERGRHLG